MSIKTDTYINDMTNTENLFGEDGSEEELSPGTMDLIQELEKKARYSTEMVNITYNNLAPCDLSKQPSEDEIYDDLIF